MTTSANTVTVLRHYYSSPFFVTFSRRDLRKALTLRPSPSGHGPSYGFPQLPDERGIPVMAQHQVFRGPGHRDVEQPGLAGHVITHVGHAETDFRVRAERGRGQMARGLRLLRKAGHLPLGTFESKSENRA